MKQASDRPTGVVLCGGESTRMGEDKANVCLAGKPLAIWVAEALAASGAQPVVAQGGRPPAPLPVEPDSAPAAGPLAALVDALERHGNVLVCPTDVPTVPAELLAALIERACSTGAPVVLARSDRAEPLIGHYATSALEMLREGLRSGARGPSAALEIESFPYVLVDASSVMNVNTPADLAAAEAVLAARKTLHTKTHHTKTHRTQSFGAQHSGPKSCGPQSFGAQHSGPKSCDPKSCDPEAV